jgi:hypothetical protein
MQAAGDLAFLGTSTCFSHSWSAGGSKIHNVVTIRVFGKLVFQAALLGVLAIYFTGALPRGAQATRPDASAGGPGTLIHLTASADAYVSSGDPNTNFGSASVLDIYADLKKPLFRFDLSSVPRPSTILSATLVLNFKSAAAEAALNPKRYNVYDVAATFDENAVTYQQSAAGQPWVVAGLGRNKDYAVIPFSAPIWVTDPGEYPTTVTDLVRPAFERGDAGVSIALVGTLANASGSVYSRESSDSNLRPRLEIRYSKTTPIARADEVAVKTGTAVLDGSKSALPNGTQTGLRYSWSLDAPAWGSAMTAGQPLGTGPSLSFQPDQGGTYALRLQVTNPATGETGETVVRATTGLRDHPRLSLNDKLLAQIHTLRDSGDPVWTRFYNWVQKKPTYSDFGVSSIQGAYLMTYLVTGDRKYFDWTWDLVKPKIYNNKTDRSGGLTTILQINGNDAHSASYLGGSFTASVALFYDWGYALLSQEQREDLIAWMNAADEYNVLRNSNSSQYFRNDGASVTYGLAASAYATLGENPDAFRQLGWFRNSWSGTLKALDIMGTGGAAGEGNAYGTSPTAANLIRAANAVYYATGEDLFVSHPWFRQRLAYDAFATYPGTIGGPGSPVRWGWPGVMLEQSSLGGDGRRGSSWHSLGLRPNGLILSRRFAGTEEADTWNWVYRQPAIDGELSDANCYPDLLYYSPRPRLVKPARLSHFDPSMGFVYIRSDWDSPDATWISFWAGPHLDTHQHLDQGAFTIFKRRDLAPKTGHLDRNDVGSPHSLAYYTRTVSSNNLLVGDPSERFQGFIAGQGCDERGGGGKIQAPDGSGPICIPNDGGQRTMRPFSLAPSDADLFKRYSQVFDVAKVVHYDDNGAAVSVVADLTNAYNNARYSTPGNSPKVNKVYRSLVYLREPDVLLIADTVESANSQFEKKWLLHALDRIEIGGTPQTVDAGETVYSGTAQAKVVVDDSQLSDANQTTFDMRQGYAALLLNTVFPNNFRYRLVGGRQPASTIHPDVYAPDSYNFNAQHFHRHIRDFWIKDYSEGVLPNHRSFNWMPESPIEAATAAYASIFGPGYGRWRLEIEPVGGNQTDYFLNALRPTVQRSTVMPVISKIETSNTFGATFSFNGSAYSVEFNKGTLDPPRLSVPAYNRLLARHPSKDRRK